MEISRNIHLSIISHGQLPMIKLLLNDLASLSSISLFQLTIILNIEESEIIDVTKFPFPIQIINNDSPKGFGENHNQAFLHPPIKEARKYFFVINPDVRITQDVFSGLMQLLSSDSKVGIVAPVVVNEEGELEDSIRILPTPRAIFKKFFGYREEHPIEKMDAIFKPDWIAGMFMGFRSDVFRDIQGFDDKFFLYYEDVDLCSRLWLNGFQVQVNPKLSIIHTAQRDSHRNFRYLRWHLASMLRFFLSDVYRQVKKIHINRLEKY